MLMRFDPFRELDQLAEHFRDGGRMRPMLLDAYQTGDIFHVDFDLPGIEPKSIDVTVDKNILSVTAERHWDTEGVDVVVRERAVGTFTRQLLLSESLDTDNASASYENGVLRLAIPVTEKAKVRHVEIKAFGNDGKTEPVLMAAAF
ncbi:MAG TPA: Hsp20/alpha crystallin family protein [Acidimicrobiales bacterium]|nr:Hsp20/alpha crystallin family protein [Acidimicrobiales bacterium]